MASFLIDGYVEGYLALARNYRESADALLDSALKSGEPRDWGYPVLSSLMVSVMKPLCNPDRPLGRGVYRTLTGSHRPLPGPARQPLTRIDRAK